MRQPKLQMNLNSTQQSSHKSLRVIGAKSGAGVAPGSQNQLSWLAGQFVGRFMQFVYQWPAVSAEPQRSRVSKPKWGCDDRSSSRQPAILAAEARFAFGERVEPPDSYFSYTNQSTYQFPTVKSIVPDKMNEQTLLSCYSPPDPVFNAGQPMPGVRPSESPGLWKTRGQHREPEQQSTRQVARRQRTSQNQWATSGLLTFLFMVITQLSGFAQSASVNLSLSTVVSNKKPAIGNVISYTLTVGNTGPQSSTGVTVKVQLPTPAIASISAGAGFVSGPVNATTGVTTGTWTVGTLGANATATLVINATVQAEGVFFLESEVQTAGGTDTNSSPGNGSYIEDDYANVCFAVPLPIYDGEEYTVTVPSAFTGTMWMVNGVPLTPALSATAVANSDGSLTIKKPGTYSFTSQIGASGCAAGNCCNIEVVPGPPASLGNFVFYDNNGDGQQSPGEAGVPGVTVTLYEVSSSTSPVGSGTVVASTVTTAASGTATGNYSFTGLPPACYYVVFSTATLPAGYSLTMQNATNPVSGTAADTVDSDADPTTGASGIVCLAPSENNPTLDAGVKPIPASLGNFVFSDTNGNGIQDAGEPGVPGVTVILYTVSSSTGASGSGVFSQSTITTAGSSTATGNYSFTGLAPGCYEVQFVLTPSQSATDRQQR
jgi:uncharacterized repeat protein (TIGR01451 family)